MYLLSIYNNLLVAIIYTLTRNSPVWSIISYGLPFCGGTYSAYTNKFNTTTNYYLLKFIFFKPKLYQYTIVNISTKVMDYGHNNLYVLYYTNVHLLMFKFKEIIETSSRGYNKS